MQKYPLLLPSSKKWYFRLLSIHFDYSLPHNLRFHHLQYDEYYRFGQHQFHRYVFHCFVTPLLEYEILPVLAFYLNLNRLMCNYF